MRKVVAAYVDDDAGAAIDVGDFPHCVRARPLVGAKFFGEFGEPVCAGLIKGAGGLADPANFEFVLGWRASEEFAADCMREQKCAGMASGGKFFGVAGMEDCGVVEEHGPADTAIGGGVDIGMKAQGGYGRFFEPDGKKRVGGLEVEDGGGWIRAGAEDLVERSVKRDRIVGAEEFDIATAEGFGITGNELPVMFFAAKAKNGHARAEAPLG